MSGLDTSILTSETQSLDPQSIAWLREKSLSSLYFFNKVILGFTKLDPRIHRPLCRILENESLHRLRIIFPRGWFKTTICTIGYPIWKALKNTNRQFLILQNTYLNATKKLYLIRQQFELNPLLRCLFPEVLPDGDCNWTKDCLTLKHSSIISHGGTFEAAGIGTDFTGRHFDEVIEDDTVTPDLDEIDVDNVTPTKEDIGQAIGLHKLVTPLLKDRDDLTGFDNRMIVVGTRWFELDLLSWIQANEPTYTTHERACRETNGVPDVDGTITWPEKFGEEKLTELRTALGPYLFKCLYLNLPTRGEDMTFRSEWIKFYEEEPSNLITYTSVDLAGISETAKQKKRNDFNVVITSGKDIISGRIFVLEVWEKQTNPSDVINEILRQHHKWNTIKVACESVAYQNTFLYALEERKRKEKLFFYCEGITHGNRSKETRIRGLQPLFANEMIFIRQHFNRLRTQLETFPYGAHDDIIDALSMQLSLWAHTRSVMEKKRSELIHDPMSFDYAEKEIEDRFRAKKIGLDDSLSIQPTDPFADLVLEVV